MCILWIMVAVGIQSLNYGGLRVSGIACLTYSTFSFGWVILTDELPFVSNGIFLIICYAIIILCAMTAPLINNIYKGRKKKLSLEEQSAISLDGELSVKVDISANILLDNLRDRCKALGEYYALSPRETDVLFYIAQGRSQRVIHDRLILSMGTVKTHLEHIFSKMNVHSKQEIIDLVFNESH
jgi:DNA-binding CsgD family transcriptional regulator